MESSRLYPSQKPKDLHKAITKELTTVLMNDTNVPHAPRGSAEDAQQSSVPQAIRVSMEGIFRDLMRGLRVEETLGSKGAPTRSTCQVEAPKTATVHSRSLEKMRIGLVDGIARAELAEAMLALKAAYWLDHQKSADPSSQFYHSVLPHSHRFFCPQLRNYLPIDINSIRLQSTNIPPDPSIDHLLSAFTRYKQFSDTCGWKLLSLLSLSRTFRNAVSELSKDQWLILLELITENSVSFDLIIKTIRRKHGAILVAMFEDLGITESIVDSPSEAWMAAINWTYASASDIHLPLELENLGDPMAVRYLNHPHRWFVAVDKSSIKPVTPVYTPIEHSILHLEEFPPENDPRYIGASCEIFDELVDYERVVCDMCEAIGVTECDNVLKICFPEPLVEVIETDGKGLGVRSLQAIQKGTVLGEYAGLIRIYAMKGDVYVLNGHLGYTDENFYLTTSLHQGNFTRFVNHSCSANCFLTAIDFRGRKISVLTAIKDIEIFEEITADYGEDYFIKRGMKCKCGVRGCKIG